MRKRETHDQERKWFGMRHGVARTVKPVAQRKNEQGRAQNGTGFSWRRGPPLAKRGWVSRLIAQNRAWQAKEKGLIH